jgi:hypothetical protein
LRTTIDPDPASSTPGRARLSWRSAAFVVPASLIVAVAVLKQAAKAPNRQGERYMNQRLERSVPKCTARL